MATQTAQARRAQQHAAYEAFVAQCPSRQVLDLVSSKWVTLVLAALAEGPMRYNRIAERVAGVSPKMLTQTLRSLERDGMVERTVTPEVPVRVDYELTALGRDLVAVVAGVKAWAEAHIDDVLAARARADGR